MTRSERLERSRQIAAERLAKAKAAEAKVKAQQRAQARDDLAKRCTQVGALAQLAGLLAFDDRTLLALFHHLATLRPAADPVATLDSLMSGGASVPDGLAEVPLVANGIPARL